MSDTVLVVLSDLADRPANRSALTWAAYASDAGRAVSVLVGGGGPLRELAATIGPVVDTGSVNDLRTAQLAGRIGLAPVGRFVKSRRVRSMAGGLGPSDTVYVAEPTALDLLGWLPARARRVAVVVGPVSTLGPDRMGQAGIDVAVVDQSGPAAGHVVAPTIIEAGFLVERLQHAPDAGLVAIAGVGPDDLDVFVAQARAVRRVVPTAIVGWVRDGVDDDRWAWPLFGRGDLVDLAGVVTGVPASGMVPVRAVVEVGSRHPLVPIAARVSCRPVVDSAERLPIVPNEEQASETYLDAHDVARVGPRILAALDGE